MDMTEDWLTTCFAQCTCTCIWNFAFYTCALHSVPTLMMIGLMDRRIDSPKQHVVRSSIPPTADPWYLNLVSLLLCCSPVYSLLYQALILFPRIEVNWGKENNMWWYHWSCWRSAQVFKFWSLCILVDFLCAMIKTQMKAPKYHQSSTKSRRWSYHFTNYNTLRASWDPDTPSRSWHN